MNDSQHDALDDAEQQDLLDRITQQLREQSIPPLPTHCEQWTPESAVAEPSHLHGSRLIACWMAVAAALLLMLGAAYWGWSVESHKAIVEDDAAMKDDAVMEDDAVIESEADYNVQTLAVGLTERLDEMQLGLDELDSEIAELKRQAAFLDARRKAESLLNAMDGPMRTVADES